MSTVDMHPVDMFARTCAGTHVGSWVGTSGTDKTEREREEHDTPRMCRLIEHRMRQSFWIGFTDKLPESVQRLSKLMGIALPDKLGRDNRNKHPALISDTVRAKIRALTPVDHWAYANAVQLASSPNHVFTPCPTPAQIPCRSTRTVLRCTAASAMGRVEWSNEAGGKDA